MLKAECEKTSIINSAFGTHLIYVERSKTTARLSSLNKVDEQNARHGQAEVNIEAFLSLKFCYRHV